MQIGTDTATPASSAPRTDRVAARPDRDGRTGDPNTNEALWNVAQDLEATFIAEMLKHGGLGTSAGPFSGGAGEEQFGSFLTQEYAKLFTERGGIGLAESVFRALTAQAKDQ